MNIAFLVLSAVLALFAGTVLRINFTRNRWGFLEIFVFLFYLLFTMTLFGVFFALTLSFMTFVDILIWSAWAGTVTTVLVAVFPLLFERTLKKRREV